MPEIKNSIFSLFNDRNFEFTLSKDSSFKISGVNLKFRNINGGLTATTFQGKRTSGAKMLKLMTDTGIYKRIYMKESKGFSSRILYKANFNF